MVAGLEAGIMCLLLPRRGPFWDLTARTCVMSERIEQSERILCNDPLLTPGAAHILFSDTWCGSSPSSLEPKGGRHGD